MTWWVILGSSLLSQRALACPGAGPGTCDDDRDRDSVADGARPTVDDDREEATAEDGPDPGRCARRADLVGPGACSWTTEMVAQRVLEEGSPWTYVGRLTSTQAPLPSKVAAPFTIGPDARIHVVANQVLEQLHAREDGDARLELVGRLLEVDGTSYFVATSIRASRT